MLEVKFCQFAKIHFFVANVITSTVLIVLTSPNTSQGVCMGKYKIATNLHMMKMKLTKTLTISVIGKFCGSRVLLQITVNCSDFCCKVM